MFLRTKEIVQAGVLNFQRVSASDCSQLVLNFLLNMRLVSYKSVLIKKKCNSTIIRIIAILQQNTRQIIVRKCPFCREFRKVNTFIRRGLSRRRRYFRSNRSYMFSKIGALKKFAMFTGKRQCLSLFLMKLLDFRPEILFKRGSQAAAFLCAY